MKDLHRSLFYAFFTLSIHKTATRLKRITPINTMQTNIGDIVKNYA
jgi:hypothetical protein